MKSRKNKAKAIKNVVARIQVENSTWGGLVARFDESVNVEALSPVFDAYAKQAVLLGDNGQGQRCKMVNQICIAGILQGLSEALQLAQSADLDIEKVVNVLQHGAAGSWQMENRAVTMSQGKFDFGFADR